MALFGVPSFVLTEMSVARRPQPDTKPVVFIQGRKPGFWGFVLTLLQLEPICSFKVTENAVSIHRASLFGSSTIVCPVNRIASAFFGLTRPIMLLVQGVMFFLGGVTLFFVEDAAAFGAVAIVLGLIAFVLYFVKKKVVIGIETNGGKTYALAFKGAILGGKRIDEKQAEMVVYVIRDIILRLAGEPAAEYAAAPAAAEPAYLAQEAVAATPEPAFPAQQAVYPAAEPAAPPPLPPLAAAPATVRLDCSACGYMRDLEPKYAGKRVKCPKCGAAVRLPG